jgi:hypothetical protein
MEGSLRCPEITTGKDMSCGGAHKAYIEFKSNNQQDRLALKVWHKGPSYMALVTEGAETPSAGLQVGQRLSVRYQTHDPSSPCQFLEAVVRKVSLKNEGPLNGCYLVEMDILN